jgi:hypothetical protein
VALASTLKPIEIIAVLAPRFAPLLRFVPMDIVLLEQLKPASVWFPVKPTWNV